MTERQPVAPAPEPAPGGAPRGSAPLSADEEVSTLKRVVNTVGVDNLSLVLALILIVTIVIYLQPLFLSWQNLMNSLSQSIVIVGLLALGETVVIVAGMLDISGLHRPVASVTAATAIVYGSVFLPGDFETPSPSPRARCPARSSWPPRDGAGVVNGLIVTS
jgi:ribose/xylose/arabinose/galactoside ABC-type transport system permease subunit